LDDGSGGGWIVISICVLVLIRFVNNLLKAGFFGLGSISVIALAQKSVDSKSAIGNYLNNPIKLSISAQIVDKLSLFVLLLLGLRLAPDPTLVHWVGAVIYLLLFDLFLPNVLAAFHAENLLIRLFPPLRPIYALFYPLTLPLAKLSNFQKARENGEDDDEDPEDIRAFIRAGTDEGIIEEKDHSMLHNLLNFNDTIVREIMTPRTDMICADIATPKDDILELFKETKHSRIPIYRGDFDHIEGVLRFKDFVGMVSSSEDFEDHLLQPLFVPEGRHIRDLMTEMLKNRLQMAVVIDEYGGTSGLVTLEDLVEEIVGDIHEEHEDAEPSDFVKLEDGSYLIHGRVLLEDFCEFFRIDISDEDVDTVGGYIFFREGRILEEGSETQIGPIKVRVEKADERRIYQIRAIVSDDVTSPTP